MLSKDLFTYAAVITMLMALDVGYGQLQSHSTKLKLTI